MHSLKWLASLVLAGACGAPQSASEAAGGAPPPNPSVGGAAQSAVSELLIKPLPEGATASVRIKGSVNARRVLADADPLGERSDYKISRSFDVTCLTEARLRRGIGPDGPTPEQKAILDVAEQQSNDAQAEFDQPSKAGSFEAQAAACGNDEQCITRLALDVARDPEKRRQAEANEKRNAAIGQKIDDAAARATAVYLEPNWQFLAPIPRASGEGACVGTVTADDVEVYRFGFDGADMGEGVETRSGAAPAERADFDVWFDLKRGRLVIDAHLGAVLASIPSTNVGARKSSRNAGFAVNDDWGASAGEITRLDRGDVSAIVGQWKFTSEISPAKHKKFSGGAEFEFTITAP